MPPSWRSVGSDRQVYGKPATNASSTRSRGTGRLTSMASSVVSDAEATITAVIHQKGTKNHVGAATMSLTTGTVILTQVKVEDTPVFTRTLAHLRTHAPAAVIIHEDGFERAQLGTPPTLNEKVKAELAVPIHVVYSGDWNELKGLEMVERLRVRDGTNEASMLSISDHTLGLRAICALMTHLAKEEDFTANDHSLPIRFQAAEGLMFIDAQTAKDLELVANSASRKKDDTLLATLDHCQSPMGKRMLRLNILQPFNDLQSIQLRQGAIQEFMGWGEGEKLKEIRYELRALAKVDIDRILVACARIDTSRGGKRNIETSVALLLQIRSTTQIIDNIKKRLAGCNSDLLQGTLETLKDDALDIISFNIDEYVETDHAKVGQRQSGYSAKFRKLFAIKEGVDKLLDVARVAYDDCRNDIQQICRDFSSRSGLQVDQNWVEGGFNFCTNTDDLAELETEAHMSNDADMKEVLREMLYKEPRRDKTTFRTKNLIEANNRLHGAEKEIFTLSDQIVCRLLDEIHNYIGVLYECSEALATLDVVAGFAHAAKRQPEFSETLAVRNGRHPILDKQSSLECVPNNIYASHGSSHFQIIRGPNMSGKSTYLRQIALLTIQASIGCYVPADHASFCLHDSLLSRLSNDDCMERSLSTFGVEMASSAMILNLATKNSLVLIDELGRGTSPQEGIGLCHAIGEALIKTNAFVFFVTHFSELSTTLSPLPGVISLHLAVENRHIVEKDDFSTTFRYKIVDGVDTGSKHYGLETAKLASLPESVMARAKMVANRLSEIEEEGQNSSVANAIASRRKTLLELRSRLQQIADNSRLNDADLAALLRKTQNDCLEVLSRALQVEQARLQAEAQVKEEKD